MNYWLIGSLITAAVTTTGVAVNRIVWLAGLKQALRDTRPDQRPEILRAYNHLPTSDPGPPPAAIAEPPGTNSWNPSIETGEVHVK